LADINEIEINRNLANCILAGILTDTANFLYPSVSSKTMEISSKMMALGAQFPKLLNSTWRNKSFLEMKIWGLALANLKVNEKYNIASSVLPYEDLNNFKKIYGNFSADVFGDITGFLSSLSETDVTMLIREEERGKIKGSLRVGSLNSDINKELGDIKDIDVTKLAKIFGGGGHKKASGFLLEGSIVKENDDFRVV
jgi:phosphoesterase RecJ-like protein